MEGIPSGRQASPGTDRTRGTDRTDRTDSIGRSLGLMSPVGHMSPMGPIRRRSPWHKSRCVPRSPMWAGRLCPASYPRTTARLPTRERAPSGRGAIQSVSRRNPPSTDVAMARGLTRPPARIARGAPQRLRAFRSNSWRGARRRGARAVPGFGFQVPGATCRGRPRDRVPRNREPGTRNPEPG